LEDPSDRYPRLPSCKAVIAKATCAHVGTTMHFKLKFLQSPDMINGPGMIKRPDRRAPEVENTESGDATSSHGALH